MPNEVPMENLYEFPTAAGFAKKLTESTQRPNPATANTLADIKRPVKKPQIPWGGLVVGGGKHAMFRDINDVEEFFSYVSPAEYSTGAWHRKGNSWVHEYLGQSRTIGKDNVDGGWRDVTTQTRYGPY